MAVMKRKEPMKGDETIFEELAAQSADFAILLSCMLESREAGSLVWE
jgi:hypothetical protein